MVKAFAERREMIVAALNGLPGFRCQQPGGAFYTFPNITGTGYDARTLQGHLLEQAGVATVAGTSFGELARAICGSLTPTAERRSARRSTEFGNISAIGQPAE